MQQLDDVFSNSFDQLLEGIFQSSSKRSSDKTKFGIGNLGDYIELYRGKKYLETEGLKLKKTLAKKNTVIEQFKQQILTQAAEIHKIKKQFTIEFHENSNRNRFLANVSHELRTPLNSISGIAGLLHDSHLTKEQQKQIAMIEKCSHSLSLLINDLLDYSKIEAGALELEKIKFGLEDTIKECVDLLMFKSQEKNLQLKYHLAEGLPEFLIGDPHRLRQILLNLISNAIKFTEQGGVFIQVERSGRSGDEIRICFRVKDTGIGIPEPQQEKLFTRYAQADPSTSRKYGGTGLGLSISKELAELMGGKIGLESTEGVGSTFWFTAHFLKTEEGERAINQLIPILDQALPPVQRNLKILLVEDDLITRKVSLLLLNNSGQTQVDIAENGLKAIQKLQQSHYDLVLMDMQMPEMDGIEATRQIRQFGSNVPNSMVPIIAMTSNTLNVDRMECQVAGMNGFVSKPLDTAELNQMISQCVQDSYEPWGKIDTAESLIEFPTVHLEKLSQMRQDVDNKFEPLVRLFLDQLPSQIGKMQAASADNNFHKLKEIAHKLRGNSASFCAEKMADLCQKIEQSAQDNKAGTSQLLSLLEGEAQNISKILQLEIQTG